MTNLRALRGALGTHRFVARLLLAFASGVFLYSVIHHTPPSILAPLGVIIVGILGMTTELFPGGDESEWTRYLEATLKTERDRLMSMLNTMEEGVAIVGNDYKVRYTNPSLVRDFGEGVGRPCHLYLLGRNTPCPSGCHLPRVIGGATDRREYTIQNGTVYDLVASPFTDSDQTLCMLIVFRNITQRKRFEAEMVKLDQMKSDLLSQRAKQLEDISRQLAKLEEDKRNFVRFLGVVAHDLQSPLAATQTCLWNMLDGYSGKVDKQQKELLEQVTHRIDGLMMLITDLLDIPRIESGQIMFEMKEISLGEIVSGSVDDLKSLAEQKGISIEASIPECLPKVMGADRRLKQVVNNLISNAIKYSRQGRVLARVAEDEHDLRVEVMDSGIGIPPQDMSQLFSEFFRGRNQAERGTGLGLSISKRIIEAHGGRIWAESPCAETGMGSKFAFTIPKRVMGQVSETGKEA